MRRLLAICLVTWSVGTASATTSASLPYAALVNGDNVPVRSGPGSTYAPTGKLFRSAAVEVYRHDSGGWCAIRPPEGSFSWVSAAHLRMIGEADLAEVTTGDAQAWVGTSLQNTRLPAQVRLDKGEVVQVLALQKRRTSSGEAVTTWYKIAPPSGEFRWIHRRYLDRAAPVLPRAESISQTPRSMRPWPALPTGAAPETAASTSGTRASSRVAPAGGDVAMVADALRQAGWVLRPFAQRPAPTTRSDDETADKTSVTAPDTLPLKPLDPNASFDERLTALGIELSAVVAKEPTHWRLEQLRLDAEKLVARASAVLERSRSRLLLDEVQGFEEIAQRYRQLADSKRQPRPRGPLVTAETASPETAVGTGLRPARSTTLPEPQFDGTGWLMPLVSNRTGPHSARASMPAYALTDDHGNILQLVSPMPGLNLRRYYGKQIGIFGQRNDLPGYRVPHLTAQRIVSLDRHRK